MALVIAVCVKLKTKLFYQISEDVTSLHAKEVT